MATEPDHLLSHEHAPPAAWATRRERGSMALLRIMTVISLGLGRSAGRLLLYSIAAYFFVFAPTARRHARIYLRRALGREPGPLDRFRHVLSFASTIHDRFYLVNERFDLFDISIEGEELLLERFRAGDGAFLVGAHIGSFEITHALGRRQPGLRVAIAVYDDEARKINTMLAAINPAARPEVIPVGQVDAMLKLSEHLEHGIFVGVLGDRSLHDEPGQVVNFLGRPARFPVGAMRIAAILRRPVFFMVGLYRGKNRYHVVFEPLADFSATPAGERRAAVAAAIERYAKLLEKYCRSDPYNWFNFHDFWREADDTAAVPPR